MERNLRQRQRVKYAQPKRKNCTDTRNTIGLVYLSEQSKRKEKRNLIIDQYFFRPNGPAKPGQNVYFKCMKSECNVRAIITSEEIAKMGNRPVLVTNYHHHPSRQLLRLGEMIQTQNTKYAADDTGIENGIVEKALVEDGRTEEKVSRSSETEAVGNSQEDIAFENVSLDKYNSCTSMSSTKSDPLRIDYLEEMLDSHILTDNEKEKFEAMSFDLINDDDNDTIFNTLQLTHTSKFGRGLVSACDIKKHGYIGNYYGRLCRQLPESAEYSFEIFEENEKPLYVNAENESERPILA